MSGPHFAGEGRSVVAVTHLAIARSQKTRNGILGQYIKKQLRLLFYILSQNGEGI